MKPRYFSLDGLWHRVPKGINPVEFPVPLSGFNLRSFSD